MLLRIKQIRLLADGKTPGTDVPLGKGKDLRVYKFRPFNPAQPDRDHVCDVTDKADIATFLAIPSGHEVHDSELEKGPKASGGAIGGTSSDASGTEIVTAAASSGIVTGADVPWFLAEGVDRKKLLAAVHEKTGKKPHPSSATKKLQDILAS